MTLRWNLLLTTCCPVLPFIQSLWLTAGHIRTRHENLLPFTCTLCPTPKCFGRKSVLQRHIANLHPRKGHQEDTTSVSVVAQCNTVGGEAKLPADDVVRN
jgi:hypothetical protein